MGGLIANVHAFDAGAAERVRVHCREDKPGASRGAGFDEGLADDGLV